MQTPSIITQPFILSPKEGKAIWHMGVLMHFKAVGEDTGGAFWLAEATAAMGAGPPMHVHAHEDELWYVLDGEVSFYVGDDVATVGPGSVVYGPRNVAHTFKVESPTARFLGMATPAGFENFFLESGHPAETLTIPPRPTEPPNVEALAAHLARYGTQIVGPPR
ncbi:cupin [Acrocarpospora phusangensis]|uniref:Cupin n=1 Tax=Acrocarpospora phusangensis TaxID=1070424 RepID=A0A919QGL2_9ACTN|nr:quercetin 2,3-dioxygenase [Acrocarpospora phusangensis]GIH25842.1 cupin [Acrocarpospora phusangensis]